MKREKLLLPIDGKECPRESFSLAEGFARRLGATLILLQVVPLNIVPLDNRLYDELAVRAHGVLERLARQYLQPQTSPLLHVRFGNPADQILEEARAEGVGVILLPKPKPSVWRSLISRWGRGVCRAASPPAQRTLRESTGGSYSAVAAGGGSVRGISSRR
jgi:nucleotide-binding universal stress UspA family protein